MDGRRRGRGRESTFEGALAVLRREGEGRVSGGQIWFLLFA